MNCSEIKCERCGRIYCSCDSCICEYADAVIRGDYGNGEERRRQLGDHYGRIQNIVNERLGFSKRYPE